MRYLLIDNYGSRTNGENENKLLDTLAECQTVISDRASEYSDDDWEFERWEDNLSLYLVDSQIPIVIEKARPVVTVGTASDIPAPRPGESVTDYARRITGG